jgi:hypothetical protein
MWWFMFFCSVHFIARHTSFLGKLKMIFVYECYVNPLFCKESWQEILVFEHSICIPEYNFYRSVECGLTDVSRFWYFSPVENALMVRLSIL